MNITVKNWEPLFRDCVADMSSDKTIKCHFYDNISPSIYQSAEEFEFKHRQEVIQFKSYQYVPNYMYEC